ncbi:phage terminase large subunit [Variovorax sp. RKNM96]|nr:phage terminase large subunit [Variovorax sp. RKNM96]
MAAAEAVDPVKQDFRNFLFKLWKHLGLNEPTGIQYDIALFLQHGPKRRIVQAFRGIGKSWITAAFVLWRLYRNPNERILVVSANEDRAMQFTIFCRRLISEAPFLAHLAPRSNSRKSKSRDSGLSFDVAGSRPHQSPSLRAAGITGQITGGRASLIVPDDVEVPKNSLTQTMRDRLAESVKEFDAILMSGDDLALLGLPPGEVVFLGTPQTESTLYRTLEPRGYRTRIWPARYPNEKTLKMYDGRLAPMLQEMLTGDPTLATQCGGRGASTEPRRFPDLDLLEREASYGRNGFAMQYMLNPSLSDQDRYPLKLADLMVMDLDKKDAPLKVIWGSSNDLRVPDLRVVGLQGDALYRPIFVAKENYVPYQAIVMAIDPSGRGKDELGYAIVAFLNGYLYLLRCRGLQGGYGETNLQKLADECKSFGVQQVVVESNFGDGMFNMLFSPYLQRTHPCALEEVRSSTQKELRICDTLEPVMNQHRLIVDRKVVEEDFENYNDYPDETEARYQLFYQMTRITRDKGSLGKSPDRLDALAMAVAYHTEAMDRDTMRILEDNRNMEVDKELTKFVEYVTGSAAYEHSMIDEMLSGVDID